MTERMSKKELKQDDIIEVYLKKIFNIVTSNIRLYTVLAVALLVIIGSYYAYNAYDDNKKEDQAKEYYIAEKEIEDMIMKTAADQGEKKDDKAAQAEMNKKVKDILSKYITSNQTSPKVYYAKMEMANLMIEAKEYDDAIKEIKEILAGNPDYLIRTIANYWLSVAYEEKDDFTASRNILRSLTSDSSNPFLYEHLYALAGVYTRLSEVDEAKKAYERIIKDNADSPIAKLSKEMLMKVGQ